MNLFFVRLCFAALVLVHFNLAWAKPPSVRLVFAGDSVLDDAAGALIAQGGDPFAHFASTFAAADIRITNLECVIASDGAASDKMYTFRAHPRVIPVLQRHFDPAQCAPRGDVAAHRASADDVDINHGRFNRITSNRPIRGEDWSTLINQRDVGTGATHIEGDEVWKTRDTPKNRRPNHSGRGP